MKRNIGKCSYINKIDEFVKDYEEQYNKFQEQIKKQFKICIKDFFENNKEIYCIIWTQFTPYFNDGEPCKFGVYEIIPMTKKDYDDWQEDGGYYEEYFDWSGNGGTNEVRGFIRSIEKIPEDFFNSMFGDGVEVIATREGFEINEYDHE